ncbi:PepSY-associated TM helix domain-containing protein [Chitinophaga barathri]|uniref:PepSY domain-containing protein n=1 Tax=Chitinophaga barathri TaxID=1647451 RepID=A0A3N4MGA8_9BACT|nr:PepSY-associated TM helix domain-containing protein [Chitinophaga barathri]RPD40737.1 PepSY domain-containing protein [Chitinophaga barathri]
MKKLVGKVHLWLGLTSGLVVFIISITGCLLAFEWELRSLFTGSYYHTEYQANVQPLPPSVLREIAEKQLPGKTANGISYGGDDYSTVVQFYGGDPEYYYQVFLNPYTGEVLKVWNAETDFFRFILEGHFYLWLPHEIGQPIVAYATLIFFIMLVTGLVLWWPKNKAARKQRFSIKWDAKWRRLNYDLHNVLGFYAMIVALVLVITGLVWGFEWWSNSLYYVTTGGKSLKDAVYPVSDTTVKQRPYTLQQATDTAWTRVSKLAPERAGTSIYFGEGPEAILSVSINHRPGTYYKTDNYEFDQYTLKPLEGKGPYAGKYSEKGVGDKFRRMNYDVHTGAVWGLAGKILMFCASLICASLPITGIYIWWGRKKKKPVAQKKIQQKVAAA